MSFFEEVRTDDTKAKLIDATVNARIQMKSTFLAGHKVWIHMGNGELATI